MSKPEKYIMRKFVGFSAIVSAVIILAGCSTISEWCAGVQEWYAAQRAKEFKRLVALPPAQMVRSPRKDIALCAKQSCDLFNVAQPKMRAYIAKVETSHEYLGFVNDVQYYIEEEKMSSAEAQKKVRDAVIAADAKRPDDEKVWPKIQKGAVAARQWGSEDDWKQFWKLSAYESEVGGKVRKICKEFDDREKHLRKLSKNKQISKEQFQAESSVIKERRAECAAIQKQLSDARGCISFMMDQYQRAKELEDYAH